MEAVYYYAVDLLNLVLALYFKPGLRDDLFLVVMKGLCFSIMRMAHSAFLSSFHLPLAVDNYAVTAIGEIIPKLLC